MTSIVEVKLEQVDLTGEKLSVEYRVTNRGDAPAYVVSLLCQGWDEEDRPMLDSEGVYRRLEDDRLIVARTIIPVPPDIDLEVVQYPLFQKLEPKASLEESFALELPTCEYSPHDYEDADVAPEAIEIPWSLEIGFVELSDLAAVSPVKCQAADGTQAFQIFAFNPQWLQVTRVASDRSLLLYPPAAAPDAQ